MVKYNTRDVKGMRSKHPCRNGKESLGNVRGKIARELFRIQNRILSFSFFITQIIVNNIIVSLTSP